MANLPYWTTGDVISASRLNAMVDALNNGNGGSASASLHYAVITPELCEEDPNYISEILASGDYTELYFTKGNYNLSTINLVSGAKLIFERGAVITSLDNTYALKAENCNNIVLQGGEFTSVDHKCKLFASFKSCNNVQIIGVEAHGMGAGIQFLDSTECRAENCKLYDFMKDGSGGIGVVVSNSSYSIVRGNIVDRTYQDSILIYNGGVHNIISNNICSNWNRENDYGRAAIQAYYTRDCIIENNVCYNTEHLEFKIGGNETGIRARDCDRIKIHGNSISDCLSCGVESILLNDCTTDTFTQTSITITNNSITNVGNMGIYVGINTPNTTIYPNNHIISNNMINGVKWVYQYGAGTGINCKCTEALICNNIVKNVSDIGINAYDKSYISGNIITDVSVPGMDDNVGVNKAGITFMGENITVAFNRIYNNDSNLVMNFAIRQYDANDATVLGNYCGGYNTKKVGTWNSALEN